MKNISRIVAGLILAVAVSFGGFQAVKAAGGYGTVIYGIAYPWIYGAGGAVLGSASAPTHGAEVSITVAASTGTCGGLVSTYYCGTGTLTGGQQFTTPASVVCGNSWTQTAPDIVSGYYGTQSVINSGTPATALLIWSKTGPVTTMYFGSTQSSIASETVSFYCTGY